MSLPYGDTPKRLRAQRKTDPYNTARTVEDWTLPPVEIELPESYINSSSTTAVPAASRTQQTIYKSLFSTDVTIDVKTGDRIQLGDDLYKVLDRPAADRNPFTGWQPYIEIPLTGVQG